jgi:uncharacterized protein (TIGR03435 family)
LLPRHVLALSKRCSEIDIISLVKPSTSAARSYDVIQVIGVLLALLTTNAQARQNKSPQPSVEKLLVFGAASVKPVSVPSELIGPDGGLLIRAPRGSSVKMPRNTGGPGTGDPGRIHYPVISLKSLLAQAFDSYSDIIGPSWLSTQFFQVDATMPTETTKAQFQGMLRNLIKDRFKFDYHINTKEVSGYSLTVGKDGSKMKESASIPVPETDGVRVTEMTPSLVHMVGHQAPMKELADTLGFILRLEQGSEAPPVRVMDATGLSSKYDFTLEFSPKPREGEPPGDRPNMFSALQSQLGLKLDWKKTSVEVLIIERIEKTPSEN